MHVVCACAHFLTIKHISPCKAWSWGKRGRGREQGKARDPRVVRVVGAPAGADQGDCGFKDKAERWLGVAGVVDLGGVGR